ncbi:hypothetical protein INT47_009866 [Mucor saturninus]|uniref:Uncharacterized protein n=1 Tax=Mucor saturninus TaxID=64648 RepID=A0A8H7V1T9_9FUNG|nr:hypothetical protein INT47_009866 [Mucor saturninus]
MRSANGRKYVRDKLYQVPFSKAVKHKAGITTGVMGLSIVPKDAEEILRKEKANRILVGHGPTWTNRCAVELGIRIEYNPAKYCHISHFWAKISNMDRPSPDKCARTTPLYGTKPPGKNLVYVHFKTEAEAARFILLYAVQKRYICRTLETITVRTTLCNGSPVAYCFIKGLHNILGNASLCCCKLNPEPPPPPQTQEPLPPTQEPLPSPTQKPSPSPIQESFQSPIQEPSPSSNQEPLPSPIQELSQLQIQASLQPPTQEPLPLQIQESLPPLIQEPLPPQTHEPLPPLILESLPAPNQEQPSPPNQELPSPPSQELPSPPN